ncbi:hypothetical protein [Desulfoplanes formicivorans]|uniref:Glycosyltransferase subfamily 4-like N-terminal domain-containing protein n=1 Tax=Desulfoplanes formicivorans TaxID=1592317 RepID=A0A194AEJ5_9BACT|nr:hypothetical protein [Desulfoplanes formicivorans]GAU07620.1 hypothetical protein DPF_0310 [Desulfoplanes formicivorans]
MKILIITHYFPPMNSIASLRPYSWAKYWSRAGHDVTVLTTKKNNSCSNLNLENNGFDIIRSNFKFINNLRSSGKVIGENKKNISYRSLTFLKNKLKRISYKTGCFLWDCRIPNIFHFWVNDAVEKIKYSNKTFDVAVSTFAPYATFDIGYKLKSMGIVKKLVLDYRDLWLDSHMFKGIFPFQIYEKKLEKKYISEANIVVTVSKPLSSILQNKYPDARVETIENGFDNEDIENISPEPYWNDDKIRIVYTGSIYPGKRDPSPLFKAINGLKTRKNYNFLLKKLEILFVGGSCKNIEELAFKYGIHEHVKYGGFLPREDALRMQRDAHVLLFLEFEAPGVDGILTGKLFEYLASGTEIWGVGVTEKSSSGHLIKEAGAGKLFGKNCDLIEKSILELLVSELKPKLKVNKKVINRYDREMLAERLIHLVQ